MWSKGARVSLGFFRYMEVFGHNADFSSRRCESGFVRVHGRCLSAAGWFVLSTSVGGTPLPLLLSASSRYFLLYPSLPLSLDLVSLWFFFRCMEVFGCNADVSSRRCGSGFVRVRGWCLTAVGSCVSQGRRRLSNILGLSHFWALASLRARVNCRRFLAEQFFWSGDVCWACVSRVPCASKWWGSKIVLSIDEKNGRSAKCFRDEVNSANVGSVSNMLRICMFMFSFYIVASRIDTSRHDSCVAPFTWLILPVDMCLSQR